MQEVEKLVALYSKAGCRFFDLCASEEVLKAAQRGLDYSVPSENQGDYSFCVSVGIKGEPHLNKAKIDKNKCVECGMCVENCLQAAVGTDFRVREEKCIGCLRCSKVCEAEAVEIYQKNRPIEEVLSPVLSHCQERSDVAIEKKIKCIELHASGADEEDVENRWDYISENFDGMLSICIDRSKLGNEAILKRIKNLIKDRKPYSTIIQADGAPMSGGEDDFKTTLQAVAMAEVFQNEKLPVYILLSGGTNSKSAELAKLCGIEVNGVSVGSYARKIVKKYIEREDFLQNEAVFNEALKIAQNLIESLC